MKGLGDGLLFVLVILVAVSTVHANAPLEDVMAKLPPAKLNVYNVSGVSLLRVPVSK